MKPDAVCTLSYWLIRYYPDLKTKSKNNLSGEIMNLYKKITLALLFFNTISLLFAFDPIVDLNEASEIYLLNKELINIEFSEDYDESNFDTYLSNLWNDGSLKSIYFKNYLLQSNNDSVRKSVIHFIEREMIDDSYSRAILTKYEMKEIENANNTEGQFLSYDDEVFDEKVSFSLFTVNKYFSESLRVIYPWNSFSQYSITDSDNPGNDVILMVGGGTNTITVFLNAYDDHSGEEYKKLLEPNHITERYEQIYQFDVKEYLFNNESIDSASFIFGEGYDTYFTDSIKNFDVYLAIRTKAGKTYRINYFLNMSTANVNWDNYYDLARLFCLYCLMSVAV